MDFEGIQASSSIGRAPVSKTGGWGFDSLLACHYLYRALAWVEINKLMSDKSEVSAKKRMDAARWLLVAAVVAVGVFANQYFSAEPLLYRVLGLLVLAIIGGFVALQTSRGRSLWELTKEAKIEIRKVVWPTRQETVQNLLSGGCGCSGYGAHFMGG